MYEAATEPAPIHSRCSHGSARRRRNGDARRQHRASCRARRASPPPSLRRARRGPPGARRVRFVGDGPETDRHCAVAAAGVGQRRAVSAVTHRPRSPRPPQPRWTVPHPDGEHPCATARTISRPADAARLTGPADGKVEGAPEEEDRRAGASPHGGDHAAPPPSPPLANLARSTPIGPPRANRAAPGRRRAPLHPPGSHGVARARARTPQQGHLPEPVRVERRAEAERGAGEAGGNHRALSPPPSRA